MEKVGNLHVVGTRKGGRVMKPLWAVVATTFLFTGCVSYPPAFHVLKGQTIAQRDADERECALQTHSPARLLTVGILTAWSNAERDQYVACMLAKGYQEKG